MTTLGALARRLGWRKRLSPRNLPRVECDTLDIASLRISAEPDGDRVKIRCLLGGSSFDGEPRRVTVTCDAWYDASQLDGMTRSEYARGVRSLAIKMLTHELDEHLVVDGVRVFDPHRNER